MRDPRVVGIFCAACRTPYKTSYVCDGCGVHLRTTLMFAIPMYWLPAKPGSGEWSGYACEDAEHGNVAVIR